MRSQLEHRRREEQAVGSNDQDLGIDGAQLLQELRRRQGRRLPHFDAAGPRKPLDRSGDRFLPTPGRSVGLREHECHVMPRLEQAAQRPLGESGRAGEN